MKTDIILSIPGLRPIHGLKSIQTYINLFPDFSGRVSINAVDCGEVNRHNLTMVINNGLHEAIHGSR